MFSYVSEQILCLHDLSGLCSVPVFQFLIFDVLLPHFKASHWNASPRYLIMPAPGWTAEGSVYPSCTELVTMLRTGHALC